MKWFELFWKMMCVILIVVVFGDAIVSVLTGIVSFVGETTTTIIDSLGNLIDSLPDGIRTIIGISTLVLTGVCVYLYLKKVCK